MATPSAEQLSRAAALPPSSLAAPSTTQGWTAKPPEAFSEATGVRRTGQSARVRKAWIADRHPARIRHRHPGVGRFAPPRVISPCLEQGAHCRRLRRWRRRGDRHLGACRSGGSVHRADRICRRHRGADRQKL